MAGIEAIGPIYGGANGRMSAGQIAPLQDQSQAIQADGMGIAQSSSSILSLSSTSITASSETLLASNTPMLSTNEAIGAALLLLIMQYLLSQDSKQKQEIADMIGALAGMQQQQQSSGSQLLFYSSSSLSIESTQLTIATSQGVQAYSGAAGLQQVPQGDADAPSLDVSA